MKHVPINGERGMNRSQVVLIVYAAIAVITFGYSAAEQDRFQQGKCATAEERVAAGERCYRLPGFAGFFAGAAWPLYWSWEAWS